MGKSSINGPFSMAMLNNQRVYIYIYIYISSGNQKWLENPVFSSTILLAINL